MTLSLRHFVAISFSSLSTFVIAAQVQAQTTPPSDLAEPETRQESAIAEVKTTNGLDDAVIAETDSNPSVAETAPPETQEKPSQRVPMGCRIFPTTSMQQ